MQTARISLVVLFFFAAVSSKTSAQTGPPHAWSQSVGGASSSESISAVAMAPGGDVVFVGYFTGTADFGGGPLVAGAHDDLFVARYRADGVHMWSKRFGEVQYNDRALDVAVDAAGNIVVSGSFLGSIDFGAGWPVTGTGFVVKFDPSGAHLWSKAFGLEPAGQCDALAVAVDAANNVLITGRVEGSVGIGWDALDGGTEGDVFLAKIDAGGATQWAKDFGSTGVDLAYSVAADASSNIVIGGQFVGTVNFGGGNLTAAGAQPDAFVARYDLNGVHQWSYRYGSTGPDRTSDVAFDNAGSTVLYGTFENSVDFGGGALYNPGGGTNLFLVKLSPTGAYTWGKSYGGWGSDYPGDIAIDPARNVAFTGGFWYPINLGGGAFTSVGYSDMFVASLSSAGAHRWSRAYGSSAGSDWAHCVAAQGANVVMSGSYSGPVDLGGGALPGTDSFLARYGALLTAVDDRSIGDLSVRAYPNPFNPLTSVEYTIPERGRARVDVVYVSGRRVKTLANREHDAGRYAVMWRAESDSGTPASSGVYFLRVTSAGSSRVAKLVLLK